jgi:hypothetical protein
MHMKIYLRDRDLIEEGIVPDGDTLRRWRRDPVIAFPQGALLGPKTRVYPRQQVDEWLRSRGVAVEEPERDNGAYIGLTREA